MKKVLREVLITGLLALVFFLAIRSVVHNFEVNGNSMEPNLHNGQFVIVSKAAYWFGEPERGDIVVFDTPRLDHGIIHRIVGLPGEEVEMKRGEVYINGVNLEEPYAEGNSISHGPALVPEDNYFIVGDNRRAASTDIVPREDIVGKAWLTYWPLNDWGYVPNYSRYTETPDQEDTPGAEIQVSPAQ